MKNLFIAFLLIGTAKAQPTPPTVDHIYDPQVYTALLFPQTSNFAGTNPVPEPAIPAATLNPPVISLDEPAFFAVGI